MKLINIDKNLAQKYYEMDKTLLYCKLMPYKNNTCIKVYTDEGEPIGDIEYSYVSNYLNKETEILYVTQFFNDDTGMIDYQIGTMI